MAAAGASASEAANGDVLYIPTQQEDVTVELPVEDMKDVELVVDLFMAEDAPLKYWVDAARVYSNQGMQEQYLMMLREVASDDVGQHYGRKERESDRGKRERVQAFCALAESKVEEGMLAKTNAVKESAFLEAENHLTNASLIDRTHEFTEHWLAIGQLQLAKGQVAVAKRSFENALLPEHGGRNNCGGLLGVAYCAFRQGKFTEALRNYSLALASLGSARCPNYVRLCMAACYLQLKMPDMAKACYRRVLSVTGGKSAEASAGLGALKVASSSKKEVEEGLQLLSGAYGENPHLAFALISLCEQLFYRNEYGTVAKLAQTVLKQSHALEPSIKAEAYFYLGMVYHLASQPDQALTCLRAAKEADPEYLFPNHGIARVLIRKGDAAGAIEVLESIVETHPGDLEALINLSVLYKAQGEMKKAVQYAEKALSIDKGNALLSEYLADLLASLDAKKALKYYNEVAQKDEKAKPSGSGSGGDPSSLFLMNNTGVMHYKRENYVKALSTFGQALKSGGEGSVYAYPIKYNIARTHEALGSLQKASDLYKELLKQVPGYLECTLRLAAVCFSMGYVDRSIKYCKEGLAKYKNNPECLAMLVWIYLTKKKGRDAHYYIKEMEKNCPGESDFTETAKGCVYLLSANMESRMGNKDGKFEKMLNNAMTTFKHAVSATPRNMFAAHGLGVCFALLGQSHIAKKIFDKILEAGKQDIKVVDMPEVWQNKASINLESGNYQDAWRSYMYCQNKFYGGVTGNVSIAHLMAQALNAAGKKDAATKLLLKAMHLAPTDLTLKYCLAVVLMGHAEQFIQAEMSYGDNYEQRVADFNYAQVRLSLSEFYITYLLDLKQQSKDEGVYVDLDLNRSRLAKLKKKITIMKSNVESKQKKAEEVDKAHKAQQEAYNEEAQIMDLENKAKEEQMRKKAEEKRVWEEELARKQAEKLAELQEKWTQKSNRVPRSSGKEKDASGGFIAPDQNEEAAAEPSPWEMGGFSDVEDDGGDKSDEDEEMAEAEAEGGPTKEKEKKKKYKAPTKRKLKRKEAGEDGKESKKAKILDDLEEDNEKDKGAQLRNILESDSD